MKFWMIWQDLSLINFLKPVIDIEKFIWLNLFLGWSIYDLAVFSQWHLCDFWLFEIMIKTLLILCVFKSLSCPLISILQRINLIWERIHQFKILTALVINLNILEFNLIFQDTFLFNMRPSLLPEHWIMVRIVLCFESHNLMIFRCSLTPFKLCALYLLIMFDVDSFIFIQDVVSVFFNCLLNHSYTWVVCVLDLLALVCWFLWIAFKIAVLSWKAWREKHFDFVSRNNAVWCI